MGNQEHIRTIEVEGHKFEVDLRSAKRIDCFRVGDRVKILTKDYTGHKVHPGCIVGIDAFESLPTIVIAYIEDPLSFSGDGGKVAFAYLNADSKDMELIPMAEDDFMPTQQTIMTYFERAIEVQVSALEKLRERKEYFLRQYGTAFGASAVPEAAQSN